MSKEGEIWYKCLCEKCNEINWIYGGYFPDDDLSKIDVDSFKCWNCKTEQFLGNEEDDEGFVNTSDGKQLP